MSENKWLLLLITMMVGFWLYAIQFDKKRDTKFETSRLEMQEKDCLIQIKLNEKGVKTIKTTWLGENERCFELSKYFEEKYSE